MQRSSFMTYKGIHGLNISSVHPVWLKCQRYLPMTPTLEFCEKHGHVRAPKRGALAYAAAYRRVFLDPIGAGAFHSAYDGRVLLGYHSDPGPTNREIIAKWLFEEIGAVVLELSISDPYGTAGVMMESLRKPRGNMKKREALEVKHGQLSLF